MPLEPAAAVGAEGGRCSPSLGQEKGATWQRETISERRKAKLGQAKANGGSAALPCSGYVVEQFSVPLKCAVMF